jgi:hypothetical protein
LVLDYGSYIWRVRAMISGAWHPMSDWQSFNVVKPTLKEPAGAIVDATPRFVWTKESDTTDYQLQVLQGATTIYTKTMDSSVCGAVNCLINPTDVLPLGDYDWRVRTQADGTWWDWTDTQFFRVNEDPSFMSDFNTNMDGWKRVSGGWWVVGGKVLKTAGVTDSLASVYYTDANFANMRYMVKMKRPLAGCTTCATGIIIRGGILPLGAQDFWNSGYVFLYSNAGKVEVIRFDSGMATVLLPWTDYPAAVNEGYWNTLRIDAIGSSLKYYVNNTLVFDGTDTTYTNGKIGIVMFKDASVGNVLYVDWASASYRNPTTFLPVMEMEELEEVDLDGGCP